eukprot:gene11907-12991_t
MHLDFDAKAQLLDTKSKEEMVDQRLDSNDRPGRPKPSESFNYRDSIYEKDSVKLKALSVWTINDQKKLVSMNKLYLRSLEFHRNVHTKESPLMLVNPSFDGINAQTFDPSAILANVITFSADKSKRLLHPMSYSQLHAFCQNVAKGVTPPPSSHKQRATSDESSASSLHQASILSDINQSVSNPSRDYYWIHLRDLNGLDVIAHNFRMHDLIHAGFHDLRAHSTLIPTEREMLMTHVVVSLEERHRFRMYKMYIYIHDNIMMTYEVELFPDLNDLDDQSNFLTQSMLELDDIRTAGRRTAPNNNEAVASPLTSVDQAHSSLPTSETETRTLSTNSPFVSTVTDRIMQLFFKNIIKLKRKVLELGVVYIVYEISMQVLTFYDGSIEFAAASLSYFNRVVHLNLLHRERMAMMVKIHMLSAGINLLRKSIEGCVENFGKLAHIESSFSDIHQKFAATDFFDDGAMNNDRLSSHPPLPHRGGTKISFLTEDHALYLYDIHDSYVFKRNAVLRQTEEIRRVEAELDATIQLRTTNTNTMLSLIATTFLPLTFFAGVFGMNFTVDGGYSLDLLNAPYGPNVFVALCLVNANENEKIDDTKNVGTNNFEAIQRAEQEEARRREESMFMRTSYAHFSGRASIAGNTSRRVSAGSSSLSGIQNMYPTQNLTARNTIQQQALLRASLVAQDVQQDHKEGTTITSKLSISPNTAKED